MLLGLLFAPRAAHAAPQPVDGELEGEGALGHQDVGDLGDSQIGAELFAEFLELLPGVPSLHVAVLVTGTRGDVDPFCATAIEIARQGHRVRLAAHACYRGVIADRAREAGVALEFYPLAGDPIAADILNNWDVVRGEWVPLLPFAMKIGSDLYHPAHGGDERTRSGSYTRAVNGCFDPTAGGEKKE